MYACHLSWSKCKPGYWVGHLRSFRHKNDRHAYFSPLTQWHLCITQWGKKFSWNSFRLKNTFVFTKFLLNLHCLTLGLIKRIENISSNRTWMKIRIRKVFIPLWSHAVAITKQPLYIMVVVVKKMCNIGIAEGPKILLRHNGKILIF